MKVKLTVELDLPDNEFGKCEHDIIKEEVCSEIIQEALCSHLETQLKYISTYKDSPNAEDIVAHHRLWSNILKSPVAISVDILDN